ncbi:Putative cytosolic protein (plasmid) [Borrelia miyamotoi FR64b]|uniref:Putative cytosolic protein n=1 Tax=Borrelia miyamotoi FR64b TaxID=1292392 RepID=W5SH79_9SPIR|nr:Putative cytosolic protein [Borrelia miyamotoi FR64b]
MRGGSMIRLFKVLLMSILISLVSCKLYEQSLQAYEEFLNGKKTIPVGFRYNDDDVVVGISGTGKLSGKLKPEVVVRGSLDKDEEIIELGLKEEERLKKGVAAQFVSQADRLTEEQESYLVIGEAEANEIKSKVDAKLSEMNVVHNELNTSLSKLENMKTDIMNAKSDFERARSSSSNGISTTVKQALDLAIKKVKSSKDIAVTLYKSQLHVLELAESSAESAKNSTKSALRESEQVRSSGYYYIGHMTHYISDAKNSLSSAESMFNKIESEMGKLRNAMKQAEEGFAALKIAHQVLGVSKR